jgi:hypothetical protein
MVSNVIGDNCSANGLGGGGEIRGFQYNKIGNNFSGQTIIDADFQYNTIGDNCASNIFGGSFQRNYIGVGLNSNLFGIQVQDNIINNGFASNQVGDNFNYNKVGQNITTCTFPSGTNNNEFADNNTFGILNGLDYTLSSYVTGAYTCYIYIGNGNDSWIEYFNSGTSQWVHVTPSTL